MGPPRGHAGVPARPMLGELVPEATVEAWKVMGGRNEFVVTGTPEYHACDDRSAMTTCRSRYRGGLP